VGKDKQNVYMIENTLSQEVEKYFLGTVSLEVSANSNIYAKIRHEIASDNFLNLFFFNYLLENTRLDTSSANTTNQG
jgi:hypothetical protein